MDAKPAKRRNGRSGRKPNKTYRCKSCNCDVTKINSGVRLGCETRERVNRQRKGKCKV